MTTPGAGGPDAISAEVLDRDRTCMTLLRGWRLVLLWPRSKKPAAEKDAPWPLSRDPDEVARHLDQQGGAGLDLSLDGGADVVVLDVDDPGVYAELTQQLGPLPPPWVRTGGTRRGVHHYVRRVPGLPSVCLWQERKLGEIKGASGGQEQVVLPPSRHPDTGRPYAWLVDPITEPVPELPAAWRDFLINQAPPSAGRTRPRADDGWQPLGDLPPLDLIDLTTRAGLYLWPLGGGKHALRCFNAGQHTTPSSDSTTILWEPEGPGLPWSFKCLHGHCQGLGITHLLDVLGVSREQRRPPPPPEPEPDPPSAEEPSPRLGWPLGQFLQRDFPPRPPVIETLFPRLAPGQIAGEEKLSKSLYALAEALGIALGRPVCGYAVPQAHRVLFVAEEDDDERLWVRARALLRGLGLDPLDPTTAAALDQQFRLFVCQGLSLDDLDATARLIETVTNFRPALLYFDPLSDLIDKPLGPPEVMKPLVGRLTKLGRAHHFVWRLVNHYRRGGAGPRGRGSQEALGGTQLARWTQTALYFEPIGRSDRATISRQAKDGRKDVKFTLTVEAEGPEQAPDLIRLSLSEDLAAARTAVTDAAVLDALRSHPREPGRESEPGATKKAVATAAKVTPDVARRALDRLIDAQQARLAGRGAKQAVLYVAVDS